MKIKFLILVLAFLFLTSPAWVFADSCVLNNSTLDSSRATSFGTPVGASPFPSFIYSPLNPGDGKKVTFTDNGSRCFTVDGGYPCVNGDASQIEYKWSFEVITEQTTSSPPFETKNFAPADMKKSFGVFFPAKTEKGLATLNLCDIVAGCCPAWTQIKFELKNEKLPEWKEVSPF